VKRGEPLARRTPLKAKTGLKPGKALQRRTPVARPNVPPKATEAGRRQRRARSGHLTPIPRHVVAAVRARSGGRCEAKAGRGCTGVGEHRHHRAGRGPGRDRPDLILDVCVPCHLAIHANPQRAYAAGWMLHRNGPLPPPPATGVESTR
jgi:hypothetical protein